MSNKGMEAWSAIATGFCYATSVGGDRGTCPTCLCPHAYYARAMCEAHENYHRQARTILNSLSAVVLRSDFRKAVDAAVTAGEALDG